MSLFEDPSNIELSEEPVGPGVTILRNFAISEETEILSGLSDVVSNAPFRHMITPEFKSQFSAKAPVFWNKLGRPRSDHRSNS